MDKVNRAIWNKFHVKYNDVLPFQGWVGTRINLAELFFELGYTTGAEIGVEEGKYSETLLFRNPNLKLKSIDPWAIFGKHSPEQMEQRYQTTLQRLKPYKDRVEIIREYSQEAAKKIPNESLDFVYIDALHDFDSVIMDIIAWVPKVKKGGIVSGHDYHKFYQYGVIQAVDAYTHVHNINMWYITKENKEAPSWFWVKQ